MGAENRTLSGDAKIAPRKTATSQLKATEKALLARLPAPIHWLQEKGKRLLQPLLQALFDQADDALFELADKALNNQEQNLYFESMRELRVRRRTIEVQFADAIDRAFVHLAGEKTYTREVDDCGEISLDNLTLIQNEELEELVAMDSMVSSANERYGESIQHLALRIDSLVPVKVYQKNNPLGPQTLCAAFSDATRGLEVDIKARLVIYKLFDKLVIQALGPLYQAANQLLIEQNVLPSLHSDTQTTRQRAPIAKPARGEAIDGSGATDDRVLQSMRELLVSPSATAATGTSTATASTPDEAALTSSELVSMLSALQQQAIGQRLQMEHNNAIGLVAELLSQQPKAKQLDQVDQDIINLVNMLFEFILDDHNLATPMKALLGRLQIPIIKVAIADKSFFGKGGHPARKLLNEMARAALEWQPDEKACEQGPLTREDSLYRKIDSIVQQLLSDFDSDVGIFNDLLADLLAFMDKERRRASILEQRTLDAEDGKARAEYARARVSQALEQMVAERDLPEVVGKLLHEAWANVMFLVCLRQGGDSEAWQSAVKTAEDLVWSVTTEASPDNRKRLLNLVPELLKRLRNGLEQISYNPFEMTQLFKALEKIHLDKLKAPVTTRDESEVAISRQTLSPQTLPSKPEDQAPAPAVDPSESDKPPKRTAPAIPPSSDAETEAEPLPDDDLHLQQVDKLTQGTWFELAEAGSQPYRCRLAAIIKPTGKYIFVNRTGLKVAEKTRQGLATALKFGGLRVLDDGTLFERALESVIGDLRQTRNQGAQQ